MQTIAALTLMPVMAIGLVQTLRSLITWLRGDKDKAQVEKPLALLALSGALILLSAQYPNRVIPWDFLPWVIALSATLVVGAAIISMFAGSRSDDASNVLTSGHPLTPKQIAKARKRLRLHKGLERFAVAAVGTGIWIFVVWVGLVFNYSGVPLEWVILGIVVALAVFVSIFDII